ncbi:hypothetical protein [Lentzea sp. NPDC055074]
MAADLTTATVDRTPIGTFGSPLFVVLAWWALALATYLVIQAVPGAVLTAREPTWRIIVRAATPGATAAAAATATAAAAAAAAALAALAITAIAAPALNLGLGGTIVLVALLMAGTFVALNQAATAILGRAGRLASLAGHLPTRGAVIALRAAATGSPGLATGVAELCTWLLVGVLADHPGHRPASIPLNSSASVAWRRLGTRCVAGDAA